MAMLVRIRPGINIRTCLSTPNMRNALTNRLPVYCRIWLNEDCWKIRLSGSGLSLDVRLTRKIMVQGEIIIPMGSQHGSPEAE